jgi:sodium/potassium-transporting ATPase subunit alpha
LLVEEINILIKIMAKVAFTIGFVFFGLSLLNGHTYLQAIIFLIGIVVANVPEGLLP